MVEVRVRHKPLRGDRSFSKLALGRRLLFTVCLDGLATLSAGRDRRGERACPACPHSCQRPAQAANAADPVPSIPVCTAPPTPYQTHRIHPSTPSAIPDHRSESEPGVRTTQPGADCMYPLFSSPPGAASPRHSPTAFARMDLHHAPLTHARTLMMHYTQPQNTPTTPNQCCHVKKRAWLLESQKGRARHPHIGPGRR